GKEGKAASTAPPRKYPRPAITHDNRFFWDGLAERKILIQKCASCGALQHPPEPMCARCRSLEWQHVEASGRGTVFSWVVMHYPPVPPFEYPNPIGLIELEEGVRIVSNLVGVKPEDIRIGMPVQAEFASVDDDGFVLHRFRPVKS